MRWLRLVILGAAVSFASSGSFAQDKCSLTDISKFASDNCAAFAPGGSETTEEANAGLSAGLNGLVKKLSGLGAETTVGVKNKVKQYEGPLQSQVREFAKDRETCREHFADKLLDLFCKPPPGIVTAVQETLCTGEYVGNCPGPHTLYLGCPNRTVPEMLALFCPSKRGTLAPIMADISGNACGYSLLRLTCSN